MHKRSSGSVRIGVGLGVVASILTLAWASAFAAVGVGVAPGPINAGSPVRVGQTDVPAELHVMNTSTAPEDAGTLTLVNGPGAGIRATLSCDSDANSPCLTAQLETVFSVVNLDSPASGVGSLACAGQTFTIASDATTGEIIFTPDSGGTEVILGPPGSGGSGPGKNERCVIAFRVNVLTEPNGDGNPNVAGKQSIQLARVKAKSNVTPSTATASGAGETTVGQ